MSSLVVEEITEEFARQRGMVPNGTGGWKLPFYKSVRVKGLLVPVHHVDLYKRLHEMLGDLVCDRSRLVGVSLMLCQAVSCTLDMITEIESVRKTDLSRDQLDDWLEMLDFMSSRLDFSVRWILWLRPQVEEMDRAFRRSEVVAELLRGDGKLVKELHLADPEFADGIMTLLNAKAAKAANTQVLVNEEEEEKGGQGSNNPPDFQTSVQGTTTQEMDPSPRPTKRPRTSFTDYYDDIIPLLPSFAAPVAAPSASESQPESSQDAASKGAASKGVLNVVE